MARIRATSFATVSALTSARYLLTGLTNGTVIEAKVQANNSQGASGYGAEGMGTPVASVPGGGNALALRADTGDASGEVDLDWLAPLTGGATITQYIIQWRTSGQSFATSRQATVSGSLMAYTRTSLTDGTEYFFRVRARNSVGSGAWSNEASATPEAPDVPPTDTAPDAPDAPEFDVIDFETILWRWSFPDDDGGQSIDRFDFQWRIQGNNWSNANIVPLTESCYLHESLNESTTYEGRARASNSVGTSGWSGSTPATTPAEPVDPMPPADTAPATPAMPSVTVISDTEMLWIWVAPDDGGAQITDFDIQWRLDGAGMVWQYHQS